MSNHIFRDRPLVFMSSTIHELWEERRAIERGLDDLNLVQSWLFESHFAVTGTPPEDQYLALARACDLFVVVVLDEMSPATRAEYLAAYDDTSSESDGLSGWGR